jgi:hypothetical protein
VPPSTSSYERQNAPRVDTVLSICGRGNWIVNKALEEDMDVVET